MSFSKGVLLSLFIATFLVPTAVFSQDEPAPEDVLRFPITGGCSDRKWGANKNNHPVYMMDCAVSADLTNQFSQIPEDRKVLHHEIYFRYWGGTPNYLVPAGDQSVPPVNGCGAQAKIPVSADVAVSNWLMNAPNGVTSIKPERVATGYIGAALTPATQGSEVLRTAYSNPVPSNGTKWSDVAMTFNPISKSLIMNARANGWGDCRVKANDMCYACLSHLELVVTLRPKFIKVMPEKDGPRP